MNFLARLFGKMTVTRSQTISIGNNIQANGKVTIQDVVVKEGNVFLNGEKVAAIKSGITEIQIKWEGPLANLTSDCSVICGEVRGNVTAGSSVSCDDVNGSVSAGSSVTCDNVGGSVTAGNSVSCGNVNGSIHARNSININ